MKRILVATLSILLCFSFSVHLKAGGFSVTYHSSGNDISGNVPEDGNSYGLDNQVTVLGNGSLVSEHATFKGWNTSGDWSGTLYKENDKFNISDNVDLYAVWDVYPEFNFMDGEGSKYTNDDSTINLNPTVYNYNPTYVTYCPFENPSKISFVGWSEYEYGIGATTTNLIVSRGEDNTYKREDFEYNKQYFAVWKDNLGRLVSFDYGGRAENLTFDGDASKSSPCYGFDWNHVTKTLTINNTAVAYLSNTNDSSYFNFRNVEGTVTLVIKGTNTIGKPLSFNLMDYPQYATKGTCIFAGLDYSGDLLIKGDGKLDLYEYFHGIKASGNMTFASDFTGIINIYDKGGDRKSPPPVCCLAADGDITINNGTFNLNNYQTNSINAGGDLIINGGSITCSSENQAIKAENIKVSDGVTVVAKENADGSGETIGIVRQDGQIYEYNNAKYISLKKPNTQVVEEKKYEDTTCEAVIGKEWTWDETLGVCKLKGYRIVNTSTK